MKKLASAGDPLWYKDAIIYELHVRAFADSNNDGIGDLQGLISKLDYLQDLGVTCLWLLPFFPSPLRDDGYDIANYVDVNPAYGTLDDFKQFLDAAHKRNMQVMIELVINHTSDQHPWFKAAQTGAPGSPEREMYVWSNTDQLYKDARIIFTDTEKSNWTWDETAQAYYWHRFFSHQPDLNFDNPRVIEEVLNAMRFWLDMGVDALRMDAIPYLVERDKTNCENLPETHAAIKKIRAAIDADYANRLILAEANQWPADVRPYFGDGDECHMAFHFPLMPRIYMALRQEDRLPITDIMAQTPSIPPNCQWGLFLRNHDELTLEMVTDDERDYMYLAYSADPRMRVNVGIRRRLAPLVDNNRRRIELLNSLLLSFPGTPIMYYGDELGMGDNIYLGDRNGVRTPMQWNSDRNAGFSRCDPARLYFPVIMDPVYGYQVVNVEAQLSDQSSLLHWTRNMIALRKLFQVFGRGTLEFLNPANRTILAYLRSLTHEDGTVETVLCVANLSRFAQPVSLDLARYAGMIPVEMLGYVSFPAITEHEYPLTVAPYSFLWFELQNAPTEMVREQDRSAIAIEATQASNPPHVVKDWSAITTGEGLVALQAALPEWLVKQRWFGAKSRAIAATRVSGYAMIPERDDAASFAAAATFLVEVEYSEGEAEMYQVPLAVSFSDAMEGARKDHPQSIVMTLTTSQGPAVLHDAAISGAFRNALLHSIQCDSRTTLHRLDSPLLAPTAFGGEIVACGGNGPLNVDLNAVSTSTVGKAEQSNTSLLYDGRMILKLFRRLQKGTNPDIEVGRYLSDVAHFPRIAALLGEITLRSATAHGVETSSLAMLQPLVANEGDCWQWTLDALREFSEAAGETASLPSDAQLRTQAVERFGPYLDAARLLGQRTAELHVALSAETTDEAFQPEPLTAVTLKLDTQRAADGINHALSLLKQRLHALDDATADAAATVLSHRLELLAMVNTVISSAPSGMLTRIHGDYHLGQVLRAQSDFVLLDFEGEPARSLAERRSKQCPLRDVAGMLRSFSYASWAAFEREPPREGAAQSWAKLWRNSSCAAFLAGYRAAAAGRGGLLPEPALAEALLRIYILEKAMYELVYELNNRPAWVHVPLAGLLDLLAENGTAAAA